jgi:hypothetical protein
MDSFRISRLATFAGLALSLTALAPNALAETAWDQKAVTGIATKVAKSVKDLHLTVKKNPDAQVGSPQRRAQYSARESVKLLVTVSQRLASQLQAGEDQDATLPTYKRLQLIRRDAEEDGRKGNIPAPTLEKVVAMQALMDQLAPYYEDASAAAAPSPSPTP